MKEGDTIHIDRSGMLSSLDQEEAEESKAKV
jgi:hypothetical protein